MKRLEAPVVLLTLTGILGLAVATRATENTWVYKRDMPTARTWPGGCVWDGRIYVLGGARSDSSAVATVEVYDPLADSWTKMANMPSARCYHATCTFKGRIYTFGGAPGVWSAGDRSVFVYDPQTDIWTHKADMPYTIGACGIAVVGDVVYLMGGAPTPSSPAVATVMAYDPVSTVWTRKSDMPTARLCLSACAVDGKIYAVGGYNGDWNVSAYAAVEVYDPATDTWTRKGDMPTARWSLGACAVDGKIYAIGGNRAMQALTVNEVYDPATDTWTAKSPMQQRRLGHFVGSIGARIYAIGGHYPNLTVVSKTEEYDTGVTSVPVPDFNGDGVVDIRDLLRLIESWGKDDPAVDLAPPPFGDGVVDAKDLEVLMSHWGQEVPNPSLIAHWKLDETEGAVAADSAGTHDGVLIGSPTWRPTGGKIAGAWEGDGLGSHVSLPFVCDPSQGPLGARAWVKGGGPGQVIVSQAGGVDWLMIGPEGTLRTGLRPSGRQSAALSSSTIIMDGAWHRVGLAWDGTERILYVDDVEVARDAPTSLAGSTGGLYLGAGSALSAGSFWSGLIDDVRIYDRAVKP